MGLLCNDSFFIFLFLFLFLFLGCLLSNLTVFPLCVFFLVCFIGSVFFSCELKRI